MDEPATGLDYGHQLRLLERLGQLAAAGYGVLMSTHHPEHALLASTRVLLLENGRIRAAGPPEQVLNPANLQALYDISPGLLQRALSGWQRATSSWQRTTSGWQPARPPFHPPPRSFSMCQNPTSQPEVQAPSPASCSCAQQGRAALGRVVPASHELEMPEVHFPGPAILAGLGAEGLRRLVRHHHALLRSSRIGHLFTPDPEQFAILVERIADYVVETCGGPEDFSQAHGNTCMRTRHFPFSIDEQAREAWLEKLLQAMCDTDFPQALRQEYWTWMEAFSIRMINRRTTKAQPLRLSYAEACARFRAQSAGAS